MGKGAKVGKARRVNGESGEGWREWVWGEHVGGMGMGWGGLRQ